MGRKIDKIVAIHTEAIKELGKASIVQLANKINEIIDHLNEEEGWKREEGCFKIFSRPIKDFLEYNGDIQAFVVEKWEGSEERCTNDYHEGYLNIEVIGNIYENPELLDKLEE